MKKYLLVQLGYDGSSYYAFFSDKSTEELNKELPRQLGSKEELEEFTFHGFKLDNYWIYSYKVISLDDFWESNRAPLRPFDRGEF